MIAGLRRDAANGWAWRALALVALLAAAGWLYSAITQVIFRGDISGWEGAIVDHIRRVVEGKPLYAQPSLDFTPLLNGPKNYRISAALAWSGDIAFVVPRGVSLVSSLVSGFCLAALVRRQTGQWRAGIIAAGLFFIAAPFADSWYAFAHVDALQLAFFLLALLLWSGQRAPWSLTACGLALAAAVLTKQSAVLIALAIGLDGLLFRRRDLAVVVLGAFAIFLPAVLWLAWHSGAWAWHFLVVMPQKFGLQFDLLAAPVLYLKRFAPGVLLAALAAALLLKRGNPLRPSLLLLIALIGVGWLSRLHPGSGWNGVMPLLGGLALLMGLGAGWAMREPRALWRWIGVTVFGLQFALLAYDPRRSVPPGELTQSLEEARQAVTQLSPSALIMGNGYLLGRIAGSEPLGLRDYLATLDAAQRQNEMARLRAELAQRNHPPIVVTALGVGLYDWLLADKYQPPRPLIAPRGQSKWPDKSAALMLLERR
jgi:hypothetical protein